VGEGFEQNKEADLKSEKNIEVNLDAEREKKAKAEDQSLAGFIAGWDAGRKYCFQAMLKGRAEEEQTESSQSGTVSCANRSGNSANDPGYYRSLRS
jgi:hypothetical protein